MPKLTVLFGVVLLALGLAGFVITGSTHPTALIPSAVGLVLCVCGALANTGDHVRRGLWMHVAVSVALLGFLASAGRAATVLAKAHGAALKSPVAMEANVAMALVCLVFVALCVRSFLAARRARVDGRAG